MLTCPACGRTYDPDVVGVAQELARHENRAGAKITITIVCETCYTHFDTVVNTIATKGRRSWRKFLKRAPTTFTQQVTTHVR